MLRFVKRFRPAHISEQMVAQASELRAQEAAAKGIFRGSLFGMVGASLMAVLWVGGSRVGDGRMTVRANLTRKCIASPRGEGENVGDCLMWMEKDEHYCS